MLLEMFQCVSYIKVSDILGTRLTTLKYCFLFRFPTEPNVLQLII